LAQTPIIEVRDVVVRYGDHLVLDGVSFEVYKGEILAILGRSGCGKSTLMRRMIGLEEVDGGEIRIHGRSLSGCGEREMHRLLRRIGVLFQSSALIGSLTIGQNVALPIREHTDLPLHAVHDLVRMKLCMVGLAEYEFYLPSQLSGGMRKRAGLARALALSPDILFLDEPSAGLDPLTAAEMDMLIRHISSSMGTTTVMITHELRSILNVARRAVMLDPEVRGIIAQGDPRDMQASSPEPRVRRFFNPLLEEIG